MMARHRNTIIWVALGLLIFSLFRWLFGMALPEAALQFTIGTTIILMAGLACGRAFMLFAFRMKWIVNRGVTIFSLITFILVAFIAIASLLNLMIEETTLLPFAITVLLLFLVTAAVAALITFIREQYKAGISSAKAAAEQSRGELQLLQAQLSPHFLFNTLNNLYGLSLSDPPRIPPLLLKLSDLLRYSVYDVKDIFVPLQHEIDYILNYIEFERLRLGDRLQLRTEIDLVTDSKCQIPPLLLIVFVENAFKHSRTTLDHEIKIHITLRKNGDQIVFSVENSHSMDRIAGQRLERHSGFGLESVKKRLALLYSQKHSLKITESATNYRVDLQLDCQ